MCADIGLNQNGLGSLRATTCSCLILLGLTGLPVPSFPRKRESRHKHQKISVFSGFYFWIPDQVGDDSKPVSPTYLFSHRPLPELVEKIWSEEN